MDTLLVLAQLSADEERVLAAIAATSKLELVTCSKVESAIGWLDSRRPRVLVFKADLVGAERFCQTVRSKPELATTPLIALVSDLSDPFIEKLYAMGVDDAIPDRFGPGFVTRLRRLPDRIAQPPRRGIAVVAEPDRDRCNVVGRVLGNAGYQVKNALDAMSLAYYVQQHKPRLVVSSVEIGPPRELIREARRRGYAAPWIVTARRRDLPRYAEALGGLERVSVVAATSWPEVVLYAANELTRAEEEPARSEKRHLYATTVLFRSAGDESDELGFSYNVSPRGIFVRTLAPPEGENVWLELRPPKSRQRVRLEGRVTWRRPYVPTAAVTGPPGFGVEISGGLSGGVAQWVEQVRAFSASAQASRLSVRRLHTARLSDARTSGEYMLIEVPSESGVPVLSAVGERRSVPPTAEAIDDEWERLTDGTGSAPPVASEEAPVVDEASALAAPPLPDFGDDIAEPLPDFSDDTDDEPEAAEPQRGEGSTAPASLPTVRPGQAGLRSVLGPMAIGLTAGALAAGVYLALSGPPPARAPRSAVARVAPAPSVPRVEAPPPSVAAPEPRVGAPPASVAAPQPPGAARSAASSSAMPPAPSAAAPPDAGALLWDEGYLVVRSPTDAEVYATGFRVGRTNQTNLSKCGLRWVRLGRGDPPRWVSPGRTVDVKCRGVTTIDLAAE